MALPTANAFLDQAIVYNRHLTLIFRFATDIAFKRPWRNGLNL